MTDKEKTEQAGTTFMLQQTYKSMVWMIKSMTHGKDEGTYSDELKVSINCRDWMQQFKGESK